jgi:uncharacterized membrane protein
MDSHTMAFFCVVTLLQGAIMGLLLYGTVDLTNCALVNNWSWLISLVDMAWGTTACAVTALLQVSLHSWLSRSAAAAAERVS